MRFKFLLTSLCMVIVMDIWGQLPLDEECYKQIEKPALFENIQTIIVEKAAWTEYQVTPARYEQRTETIITQPAHKRIEWRNGKKCLVQYPPKVATITKRILVQPAQVREIYHPAVYRTITKQVLIRDAYIKTVVVDCSS